MKFISTVCITLLLSVLNVLPAQSQMWVIGSESWLDKLRLNKGINGIEIALYSNMEGNPYLFKDFQKGKLVATTGEEFDVNIRYDIYANEIHLKNNEEIYAIIHPEKIRLIKADSLNFIYSWYVKSPGEASAKGSSYFIVKNDGKCKLLVKKNMRVQEAEPVKLYQEPKPAKFIPTGDTYYLKLEDNSAVRVNSKKELLSLLEDQKEALNKFIGSNKLGTKKIEDLARIVTYYNGL